MKKLWTMLILAMLYSGIFAQAPIEILYVGNADPASAGDQATVDYLNAKADFNVTYVTKYTVTEAQANAADVIMASSPGSSGDMANALPWRTLVKPVIAWEPFAFDEMGLAAVGRESQNGAVDSSVYHLSLGNYSPTRGRLWGSGIPVIDEATNGNMSLALKLFDGSQYIQCSNVNHITWDDDGDDNTPEKDITAYPQIVYEPGDIMLIDTMLAGTEDDDTITAPAKRATIFLYDNGVNDLTVYGKNFLDATVYWAVERDMPMPAPSIPGNIYPNTEFDQGLFDLSTYFASGEETGTFEIVTDGSAGLSGDEAVKITLNSVGGSYWKAQFKAHSKMLDTNVKVYALYFMAKTAEPDTSKLITWDFWAREKGVRSGILTNGSSNGIITITDTAATYGPYFLWGKENSFDSKDFDYFELSFNLGKDDIDLYLDSIVIVPYTDDMNPEAPILTRIRENSDTESQIYWDATDNVGVTGYYLFEDGTAIDTVYGNNTKLEVAVDNEYFYTAKAIDVAGNVSEVGDLYFHTFANEFNNPEFNAEPTGINFWETYLHPDAGETASAEVVTDAGMSGANALKIHIPNDAGSKWKVQYKAYAPTVPGQLYEFTFKGKSSVKKGFQVNYWEEKAESGEPYLGEYKRGDHAGQFKDTLTTDVTDFGPFYLLGPDDTEWTHFSFEIGSVASDVWLDAISLVEVEDTEKPVITEFKLDTFDTETGKAKFNYTGSDNTGIMEYYIYMDGAVIDTTTSGTFRTDSLAVGTYTFEVVAKDFGGNLSDPSSSVQVEVISVSVKSIGKLDIKIYPNPVNDVLTIANLENISRVDILSITGQYLGTFNNNRSPRMRINTSDLAKGMYILKIYSEESTIYQSRFIKN